MAKLTKEEMVKIAIEYDKEKTLIKEHTKIAKGYQETIQTHMGDKTHIDLGDFGFNYGYSNPADKVDVEMLKKEFPKIYQKCLKPGVPSRTLTYKRNRTAEE